MEPRESLRRSLCPRFIIVAKSGSAGIHLTRCDTVLRFHGHRQKPRAVPHSESLDRFETAWLLAISERGAQQLEPPGRLAPRTRMTRQSYPASLRRGWDGECVSGHKHAGGDAGHRRASARGPDPRYSCCAFAGVTTEDATAWPRPTPNMMARLCLIQRHAQFCPSPFQFSGRSFAHRRHA